LSWLHTTIIYLSTDSRPSNSNNMTMTWPHLINKST